MDWYQTLRAENRTRMSTAPPMGAPPKNQVWYSQSAEEVLAQLGSASTGLSAAEVARRLAADGPNELKEGKPISLLHMYLAQFNSLIIWILIAAAVTVRDAASYVSPMCPGAGVQYPFFGLLLSLIIAGAAMSLSSVSVINNALQLRKVNL